MVWTHNLNPILVNFGSIGPIGPLEIRWYGIIYVLGFFLAIAWLYYLESKKQIELSKDEIWDFAFYVMATGIVFARLFMFIWEPAYYLFHPLNILKIWEGGMSVHGSIVGGLIGGYLYHKKRKFNFWKMADAITLPLIFALALGRIANFINGELVGRISKQNWCVYFPDYDMNCRHPSTLYAAGKRFLVVGYLLILQFWKEFKPGFIFFNFILLEGFGRFIVDFWREDILYFYLSLGQWMSLVMVLVALYILIKYYKKNLKSLFGF